MFRKILVAVGGDDPSLAPARVGGRLAAQLGTQLVIVNVRHDVPETLGEPFYSESLDHRLEVTDVLLENARRVAEEEGATVNRFESIEGSAPERILTFADQGEFSLIVVGTRGRNRLQTMLLGSVSAAIAAHSRVPVLVVPDAAVMTNEILPSETANARR